MVAFDLDGTVLKRDQTISAPTLHALYKMHRQGAVLVVATGRPLVQIPPVVWDIEGLDYIISSNGARVTNTKTRQTLCQNPLPKEIAHRVWQVLRDTGCGLDVMYGEKQALTVRGALQLYHMLKPHVPRPLAKAFSMVKKASLTLTGKGALERFDAPIEKLSFLYARPDDARKNLARVENIPHVEAVSSGGDIEVTAKGVTKGAGIGFLCRELGIEKQAVIAFGDSGNDLPMRPFVGMLVAMGDANKAMLQHADTVTATVHEDGVAQVLEQLLRECGVAGA